MTSFLRSAPRSLTALFAFLLAFALLGCRPSPSDTAEGPPVGGDVLYEDAFTGETSGSWLLEGDSAAQALVTEEHLVIEVNAPNTAQYATLVGETFTDFFVEVDATQLAGSPDSSYGILFRMMGTPGSEGMQPGFYRFDVMGNGLYVVERYREDGSWERLTDGWVAAPGFQTGLGVTNRLGVFAEGTTLGFFVNGERLLELTDNSYAAGALALDAGTFSQPGLRVAFDNLTVRASE